MTRHPAVPQRAVVRGICDPLTTEMLDRGVVIFFAGPRSVTGEDVAEFHVHASPAVIAAVLSVLGRFEGFRPAEAGEFTLRAFRNGRLDLVQAEGLADLLAAETQLQRQQAMFQTDGAASSIYASWRQRLIAIFSRLEATVDFVDEEDVVTVTLNALRPDIGGLIADMEEVVAGSAGGEILREGVRVVLAGRPNTGKSSLLNMLARREAAIVTEFAGTTRDMLEVHLDVQGVPVILIDTAGIRADAENVVEQIGIDRALKAAHRAEVVMWIAAPDVFGSDRPPDDIRVDLMIWNKADLAPAPAGFLACSTRQDGGERSLIKAVGELASDRCHRRSPAVVVRERQVAAVRDSIRHLNDSLHHSTDELELVAEDLRMAATALGRLTGSIGVEDLLDSIFGQFCVGK